MIESTLAEMHITHINIHGRILNKRHYLPSTPIRILNNGTGWLMRGGEWVEATFYVMDVLQRLDLQSKPT